MPTPCLLTRDLCVILAPPPVYPPREVAALAFELQADADKLVLLEAIGTGGYGNVYRGETAVSRAQE